MKKFSVKKLALAGMFCALCVVGSVFSFPMFGSKCAPVQHMVNVLCAVLLGPWWGGAAAGIGSMLTDLLNGYAHYAPGTFVIKGCMAIAAALLAKAMGNKAAGYAVSGVVAEVIMVAGYFGYAALLLGKGIGAAASIPGNLVQAAMGLVIGLVLFFLLKRSKVLDKLALQ